MLHRAATTTKLACRHTKQAFKILNMSSTDDDRTPRARIRDAAIRRFAQDGMGATLRSIAGDAGVSPALILHHFGSRDGLRAACDDYVHQEIIRAKSSVLTPGGGGVSLLTELAAVEGYAELTCYVLRGLQAGGATATELMEGMVQDTQAFLAEGEAAGTVATSRFPEQRARMLVHWSMGSLLLNLPSPEGPLDLEAVPGLLRAYSDRITGPALELFTEPLMTDSSLLDTYLTTRDADPTEATSPAESTRSTAQEET